MTIIYGEDVTEEEAKNLASFIEEQYEDVEVEVYNGKQPLYPYIFRWNKEKRKRPFFTWTFSVCFGRIL